MRFTNSASWWREALAPFGWLAAAMLAASLVVLALPALDPELAGWSPFWSAVELELVGASAQEADSLAEHAARAFPARVVEVRADGSGSWIGLAGGADSIELVGDLRALAERHGFAPGAFTMGSNLARIAEQVRANPASAARAAAALLPLALVTGSGVLLVLGAFLRRRLRLAGRLLASAESRRELGGFARVALGVGVGLGLAATIQVLGWLAARAGAPIVEQPWLADAHEAGGVRWVAVLVAVVVLAPLGEEVFFRGYLLPALARCWRAGGGVVLSSLVFAAVHGHPPGWLAYFVYGVGLALAARWTGSLFVPIVAHMTVNVVAVVVLVT